MVKRVTIPPRAENRTPPDPSIVPEHILSPDQEQLIGRTIATWAILELVMDCVIWKLRNLDIGEGRKITTPMTANRK